MLSCSGYGLWEVNANTCYLLKFKKKKKYYSNRKQFLPWLPEGAQTWKINVGVLVEITLEHFTHLVAHTISVLTCTVKRVVTVLKMYCTAQSLFGTSVAVYYLLRHRRIERFFLPPRRIFNMQFYQMHVSSGCSVIHHWSNSFCVPTKRYLLKAVSPFKNVNPYPFKNMNP